MTIVKGYVSDPETEKLRNQLQRENRWTASEVIRIAIKELAKKMGPDASTSETLRPARLGVEPNHVKSE